MQSEMPAPGSYEPFRLKEKIGEMMDYGRPLTKGFSRKDRDLADGLRDSMLKMENPITRAEHEEFRRRLEEENKRQDTRIGILEDSVRQIGALATSVEKLAVSMQSMLKEQEKQGKRLEALEGRDGEKWRKVMGYIATAIVGVVLGYLFKQIGM